MPTATPLRPLLTHRRWVIAVFAAMVVGAAPGVARLDIDNSPEGFFVHDALALRRFADLEYVFGRDRGVRIVLSGPGLWTARGLAWLGDIEQGAQALQGVIGAAGPYRYHRWHLPSWPPPDPSAFRALVTADPVDRAAGWVSADGSTVTVLVGLYRLPEDWRRRTLAELEALLAEPPPGVEASLAGLAVVNRELDDAVVRMTRQAFPTLLAVATLLLLAVFRRPSGVLLPLGLVAVCQTVVLGAIGYSGQRLDIITVILIPLLFVIGLATAVHVLAYQRRLRATGLDPDAATLATYRVKSWPVVWTGATTAAGFGSLTVSTLPPVRELGIWSAFAIVFLTFAMLSLYPALLASAGRASPRRARPRDDGAVATLHPLERWLAAAGRRLAGGAVTRHRLVAILFGAVALVALAGLPRLRTETSALAFFPRDSKLRTEIGKLEAKGLGVVAASLVLTTSSPHLGLPGTPRPPPRAPSDSATSSSADDAVRFDTPPALRRLEELAARLGEEPLVLGAISAGDLVAGVAQHLPEGIGRHSGRSTLQDEAARAATADRLSTALREIGERSDLDRMLRHLVPRNGSTTRITLLVPMRGHEALEPLFVRVVEEARRAFPEAQAWVTGEYPLVLAAQRTLLTTMVLALALTASCVALILWLVLGSAALAARAMVPNLWPVLFVVGGMGWVGAPVDSATVMVASVALGLAVDDTLHTLGSFRRLARRLPTAEAAREALGETAGAHALTSLILSVGFAAVAFSELAPVARFGAATAAALVAALTADLTLVPVLLARAAPERIARFVR